MGVKGVWKHEGSLPVHWSIKSQIDTHPESISNGKLGPCVEHTVSFHSASGKLTFFTFYANLTGQEILLRIISFETPKSGQMLCWNFTMYSEKSPALQREPWKWRTRRKSFTKQCSMLLMNVLLWAKIKNDIWKIRRKFYSQVFHLKKYLLEIPL